MFCTVCASPNPVAAGRCQGCGSGLRERAGAGAGEAGPAPGRRRLVALALYGLPVVVLLAAVGAYYRATWTEPAAWYARAEAAEVAGRYPEAIDAYAAASGYRDAAARRAALAAAFAPQRAAYEAAVVALAGGRHDEAIALIAPVVRAVPGYAEAAQLLADARQRQAVDLLRRADEAEARRDWLAAERALATLAAEDPGDAALAARLAALRRQHAPLVFARDRALYLVGPVGTDERLLTDAVPAAWPTWSPDRTRIAFTSPESSAGGIALYVINTDGSGLTRLAAGLRPYGGPVWSPDGTRIAFAAEGGGRELLGQSEPDPPSVRVVEVATGRVTDLTGGVVPDALSPTWSPTGDRLAFVSRAADTIASFDSPPPGPAVPAGKGEVYVATLATGAVANVSAGQIDHPWRVAWSPTDDRLLVYTRDPGMSYDRDRVQLVLLDARTGVPTWVPTGGERVTMPVWSPDGERIAYVAGEKTVVVRTIGGAARRIDLDEPLSRFLTWAVDGTALVAAAEGSGRTSYVVPLDDRPEGAPAEGAPAARPTRLRLEHDADRRQAGAPQWAPINPAPPPGPPSLAGTAFDPAPKPPFPLPATTGSD